jgi:hypothetical protein
MGLADEASEKMPRRHCGIARLIIGTDLTFDEVEEAFDRGLTSASIHRALIARYGKLAPGDQVVRRHRQGTCSCGPR